MASVQTPNKSTLSASKVTELKALCSQNSLPVSGNKGELVNRLLAHFESVQTSSTPQATPSKDLTLSSNATPPSATSSAAPPQSKPAPPTQLAALTSKSKPVDSAQPVTPTNNTPAQLNTTTDSTEEKTIGGELEKRKQRAERFGLEDPSLATANTPAAPDDLKKMMRAKRFGLTAEHNVALDQPLADGKEAAKILVKSSADLEWEARKRKRAEKFGLVDNPPPSTLNDGGFHRKNQKVNNHRTRY